MAVADDWMTELITEIQGLPVERGRVTGRVGESERVTRGGKDEPVIKHRKVLASRSERDA